MKQFKYGFLFFMLSLSACSEPQSFEFKGLQDIQLDKLTMGKNKIRANVKYYNPNAFSLVLKQIDCKVLLNNGNFTVLKLDTNITIAAKKEFLIPAQLEFQMSDLVKNSMELLLNKPVKLNIKGNATISKGIFTKTVPIEYETTQKLNLGAALVGMK
jgi:LEA14-like dessication related protein